MNLRWIPLALLLVVVLTGCARGGSVTNPSLGPTTPAVLTAGQDLPDVPVDTSLTPVSRSNLSAEAKAAYDRCVRPGDEGAVAGMAKLASARDVQKYMLTNGREPELQDDTPVWVVQLKGSIEYRWGTAFNPVCVVKDDGTRWIFLPYGGATRSGPWSPLPEFVGPELALPSLAP